MIAGLLLVAVFVAYPPFHVVSRQVSAAPGESNFNAVSFAGKFWDERLLPAAPRAVPLKELLPDFQENPAAASKTHGHAVGMGNASYYFAQGTGRITAIERSRILIEVEGRIVALRIGPVFGNAVRDGSGLLDVNQVPGLAEFNAVSAELNRLVEDRVLPKLRADLSVGRQLRFAGCAEAPETAPVAGAPLLIFIPVQAEIQP